MLSFDMTLVTMVSDSMEVREGPLELPIQSLSEGDNLHLRDGASAVPVELLCSTQT